MGYAAGDFVTAPELSPLFGNRTIQIAGPGILKNPYRRETILPDLKTLYAA